jgi:dinuclear metal center YbgI/SA1388 family protein
MDIRKITDLIENFAPLKLQESWDCSGFQINVGIKDVKKILLCLSITKNILNQAIEKNCDLIISHHPLFVVPLDFNKGIMIYSAHTNLDKADGGTTDTLIETLGFYNPQKIGDFLRLVDLKKEMELKNFINLLKKKLNLKYVRIVNNFNRKKVQKIAFCAGSGAEFVIEAQKASADLIVTGDVKYHCALESNVIIIDVGHFESEHPILLKLQKILRPLNLEVLIADEKSPLFTY